MALPVNEFGSVLKLTAARLQHTHTTEVNIFLKYVVGTYTLATVNVSQMMSFEGGKLERSARDVHVLT